VGQGKTTEHFTISTHEFDAVLRKRDKVVDLMLPSGSQRALIQSVQWDHLGDDVMHIDFLRVVIGQKIDVEVPVELVGHAKGAAKGELVKIMMNMMVSATPSNIPEAIEVSVVDLDLGEVIVAGDITMPEGVELACDPSDSVCTISFKAEEPEEAGEGTEEGAEPEVIGEDAADSAPAEDAGDGGDSDSGSDDAS
ncbi:MAG: 50S ribosomal protein L25, partial [Planctomycetes bacterium]|nr:50S ribosomal protein L25 [Planctomycetota bacterium]